MRLILSAAMLAMCALTATSQEKSPYLPEIHGTVRAKYEYEPPIDKGRFEIRNARLSVEGKVIPIVRYKAEIDLSDEGTIKMLDAYVRLQPKDVLKFTFGQMRVPFTIDAHRSLISNILPTVRSSPSRWATSGTLARLHHGPSIRVCPSLLKGNIQWFRAYEPEEFLDQRLQFLLQGADHDRKAIQHHAQLPEG